jgi:hypothetical protein
LAYAVLAVLAFLPANPLGTSQLPIAGQGNPAYQDPFQMTWFLAFVPYALTHGLTPLHTALIDHPVGVNLADNTSVPVLGLLGWPITATLGPVAAFNLLIRLAFAASGMSMFLVARRWCSSWQGPFLAGLLYAFGAYMTSQELHLDLAFVPIPPLFVLLGDELVRRQRMRPVLLGAAIGLAAAIQYLISPDVLSGCVLVAVLIGAGLAYLGRATLRQRLPYISRATLASLAMFVLVCGYPIYEMLLGPGHMTGPVIQIGYLQHNSADLLGPIAPTSNQLLAPSAIARLGNYLVGGNISENGTFLGIPLLVLLVVSYRRLRNDAFIRTCAAGAAIAFVFSLGGNLVIATWRSPVLLPGYLLTRTPLFDNTIPARYGLYVAVFVSLIVAVAVDRLWLPDWRGVPLPPPPPEPVFPRLAHLASALDARILPGHRRARIAGGAALIGLSLLPTVPFASGALPWASSLPGRIASLVPKNGVVATDPVASPSDARPMAWQALADMSFQIMGGYANIHVPGQKFGEREPWPPPPPALYGAPVPNEAESRFAHPGTARANQSFLAAERRQLCRYIRSYGIDALVVASAEQETPPVPGQGPASANLPVAGGPIGRGTSGSSTWFLDSALGPPRAVGPGYSIWVTDGRCP